MTTSVYIDVHNGQGYRDITKFTSELPSLQFGKSEPTLCDFALTPVTSVAGWVQPVRGAKVKVVDAQWYSRFGGDNGVVFTGYITDEPKLTLLGTRSRAVIYSYKIHATSEEILANMKVLPAKTYLNKTHGFILKDLLDIMFGGTVPFDVTGIQAGGTERLYQVDVSKKWTELALAFGETDGFVYRCLDGRLFYAQEAALNDSDPSPRNKWTIDETDPRYNPDSCDIQPVSDTIFNDVTVIGEDEPTTFVTEHFLSDGYTGDHNLAYAPFGPGHTALLTEDFTGSDFDDSLWSVEDREVSPYMSLFEGSLNVTGGAGHDAGTIYILSRRGIELSGIVSFRDGELAFQPSPHGHGILGGLYTSESIREANLWCGWKLDQDVSPKMLYPFGPSGVETAAGVPLNTEHHYILRRIVDVQAPPPVVDRGSYTVTQPKPAATITWLLEEINDDVPEAVVKTTRVLLTKRYTSTPPEYVLYAPVVPYDCNLVLNFVQVAKPQQVFVTVNGKPVIVGPYMDGGRCTVVTEGTRSKLAWYSINQGASGLGYRDAVIEDKPVRYFRLGESVGSGVASDHSGYSADGTATNVTFGQTGALYGDADGAALFNGSSSVITTPVIGVDGDMTLEAWVKTTDTRAMAPILGRPSTETSTVFGLFNGTVGIYNGVGYGTTIHGNINVADGKWHHIVVVIDALSNAKFFVDGVLDVQINNVAAYGYSPSAMRVGFDGGTSTYFSGSIDELAVYPQIVSDYRLRVHYLRATQSMSDVVTIPEQGSTVAVTYRRNEASRARVTSTTSIASEAALYGDNGIRQKILAKSEVAPPARTSDECLIVARAYLDDRQTTKYEGDYAFDSMVGGSTELNYLPMPGDLVHCDLTTAAGGEVHDYLSIGSVRAEPLGKGVWRISMQFGAINKFDIAQRELMRLRMSSLTDVSITDVEALVDETIDTLSRPDDPFNYAVTSISASSIVVRMTDNGSLPAGVTGYEVRRADSGWGGDGYVARVTSATLTFTRSSRDELFFIRPYDASLNCSNHSALIRVTYPMANQMAVGQIDGMVNPTDVRLVISTPRDPDFAGVIVRHGSQSGVVVYEGDGVSTKRLQVRVYATVSVGRITLDFPNHQVEATPTYYVATYNTAGEYGPWSSTVVSSPFIEGIPTGGGTGTILRKKTGSDFDTEWVSYGAFARSYADLGGSIAMAVTATGWRPIPESRPKYLRSADFANGAATARIWRATSSAADPVTVRIAYWDGAAWTAVATGAAYAGTDIEAIAACEALGFTVQDGKFHRIEISHADGSVQVGAYGYIE